MPPDDGNGNSIVKTTNFLKLVCAACTLVGLVIGGASAVLATNATRAQTEQKRADELAAIRVSVDKLEKNMSDLVSLQNADHWRVETLWAQRQGRHGVSGETN